VQAPAVLVYNFRNFPSRNDRGELFIGKMATAILVCNFHNFRPDSTGGEG
jgi:hypothetical protein